MIYEKSGINDSSLLLEWGHALNPEMDSALLSFDERRDRRRSPCTLSVRIDGRRIILGLPPADTCLSPSRNCSLMWSGENPSSVHTLVKEKGQKLFEGHFQTRKS